jgi:hypothetical protein
MAGRDGEWKPSHSEAEKRYPPTPYKYFANLAGNFPGNIAKQRI